MNDNKVWTPSDIMRHIDSMDNISEQQRIDLKVKTFYKFIKWTNEDYEEYKALLKALKGIKRKKKKTTKEIGDALEDLVNFIFEKSFFYDVFPNKHTGTNEIDQFIVLSDRGKQSMSEHKFSRDLLLSDENHILCECKNYLNPVGSTWVGKFNTVMECCGEMSVGIIFSYEGLSGKENTWYDAHGLTKVIYSKTKNSKARFILDFNIKDFEALLNPKINFFKLINLKKEALIANVKTEKLLDDLPEGIDEIKNIFNEIKSSE
ncbi:hypothetical protein [Clostridium celatum]|uniref:hypothetical protein n=1 Tax=Clostridium celatum TaxID=36834 RepID=UPI001898967E|nr:hypothetical protein [Clostridium celatum]